jgi:hypothetical protein
MQLWEEKIKQVEIEATSRCNNKSNKKRSHMKFKILSFFSDKNRNNIPRKKSNKNLLKK